MIVTELVEPELAPNPGGLLTGLSRRMGSVRSLVSGNARLLRLVRYTATSGLSTVVSEVMLISLFGTKTLGATSSAVLANVAGGILSYVLSRYWIWSEAERSRTARQLGLYWATAVVSWILSTLVARVLAHHLDLDGIEGVVVIGAAFFATYAVLWLAKFSIYQRFVFTRSAAQRT